MSDSKPEIQTLSSAVTYESRWIRVCHDEVRFADGSIGSFNTVERGNFVAIIPIDEDGNIYLVEQYRYGAKKRTIELPMGGVDRKYGADPVDSARGELLEETGLDAQEMVHVGRIDVNAAYMRQHFDVYLATKLRPGAQALEAGEIGLEVRRMPVAQMEELIRQGILTNEHTLSALYLAHLKGLI
jgi:ADP-ribose pyrophosphatase